MKKLVTTFVLTIFVLALAPGAVFGETIAAEPLEAIPPERLCEATDTQTDAFHERLEMLRESVNDAGQKHKDKWNAEKAEHKLTWEEFRSNWQNTREDWADRIRAVGTESVDDENAVNQLILDIEAAREKRDEAYDGVLTTYWDGVTATLTLKDQWINSEIDAFKLEAEAAYDAAKASCDAGEDAASIKETLRTDLGTAKSNFVQGMKGVSEDVRTEVKGVVSTRTEAMRGIKDTFKTDLGLAESTFRTYWESRDSGEE